MDRSTIELTETFRAVDTAGAMHKIRVYTAYYVRNCIDGSVERMPGTRSYKLEGGNYLALGDRGVLQEIGTGRKLRRV